MIFHVKSLWAKEFTRSLSLSKLIVEENLIGSGPAMALIKEDQCIGIESIEEAEFLLKETKRYIKAFKDFNNRPPKKPYKPKDDQFE